MQIYSNQYFYVVQNLLYKFKAPITEDIIDLVKDRKENWKKGIMDLLQKTIVPKEFDPEMQEIDGERIQIY